MTDEAIKTPRPAFGLTDVRAALRGELGSAAFVLAGSALSAFTFLIDYFGLGDGAFGHKQHGLLAAGLALIGWGAISEVRAGRRTIGESARLAAIAAQLGLLVFALNLYKIENRAFYSFLAVLVLFGFIANASLPRTMRPPFFLALSLIVFAGIFCAVSLAPGLWLFALGLGLFGIVHLPIPLWARIAMLAGAGAGLAAMRAGVIETEWSGIVLPILASVFMFRLPIYLYDIATKKAGASLSQRLSYFFMLPNAVFPFFPVVDFTTFWRTYYNQDANTIYQRGAFWILRGLIHLLLYRVINSYFVIAPDTVTDPASFLQFITANFGLYLRISGLFHMIVGLLLLFGFNLPETHTRFYFSNSFIDFWRRINIYWKDFMQKMIFNPSYMRLKRLGVSHLTSVCVSMLAVFFATWALHAYNWFWLRGAMLLTGPDMRFWGALALFLVAQTLYEARPRDLALEKARSYPIGAQTFLVIRTIATMLVICLLWSLWTSGTVNEWTQLWAASGLTPALNGDVSALALLTTAGSLGGVCVLLALTIGFSFGLAPPPGAVRAHRKAPQQSDFHFYRAAAMASAVMAALILVESEPVKAAMPVKAREVAIELSDARLNARDQAKLERGYYENLTNVNQFNSQLWEMLMARPRGNSNIGDMAGVRTREDFLGYEFIPNSSSYFNRVRYDINSAGMRDVERTQAKPAGMRRIAMIGTSRAVGWGVTFEEGFVARTESLLNQDGAGAPIEFLNFSVDGYQPSQRLIQLERKALRFAPDMVIYEGGYRDLQLGFFASRYKAGQRLPYDFMAEIAAKARLRRSMSQAEIERRLHRYRFEFLRNLYARFVEDCRAAGARPIYLYLPAVFAIGKPVNPDEVAMREIARKAGFEVIDLSRVFDGHSVEQMQLAPWDDHPNPLAHRLIADALHEELARTPLLGAGERQDTARSRR